MQRAAATTNQAAVQDQKELDAIEKEALAQPLGTHLHNMAEKAKGKMLLSAQSLRIDLKLLWSNLL